MLRRHFLLGLALAGCGAGAKNPDVPPHTEALPPLHTARLGDLLPLAGLRWAVLAKPRDIAAIAWLIPAINTVIKEQSFDRFTTSSGLDLRQITEGAVATYAGDGGDTTIYLARHNVDPAVIERLFRARLTTDEKRSLDRADVVRVSGKIGVAKSTLALIGRDVVAIQSGGSAARGPARIATLYALDKLKRSPALFGEDPLRGLATRLGDAPATAFSVGPFEGELARGARGLLAGATAIGAAARPSAREGVSLAIAVAGDFASSGPAASKELAAAWDDLAKSSFGHLLALDQPVSPALATHAPDAVAIAVELNPDKLAKGLASATSARVDEIMR